VAALAALPVVVVAFLVTIELVKRIFYARKQRSES
jgi:hypothetical protein